MVTLALIGVGKWGSHYIRVAKKSTSCRIKYIVSRDYKKLISVGDIDGIIIATPASTHFKIAKFFLERNYNLLIEKPLVTSARDARVLSKVYEKGESTVMVGHIYLHNPAFETFVSLVPRLGTLRYLMFESGNWGPFRKDVSALWDWGPHDLSMCLSIMKKDPLRVTAWSVGGDMVFLRLDFDVGTLVFIQTGRLLPEKKRWVVAVGLTGGLVFDDTRGRKITLYKGKQRLRSYPQYSQEEPLRRQLHAFCDAIRKRQRMDNDFSLGIRVAKILDLADQSIRHHGKTIQSRT